MAGTPLATVKTATNSLIDSLPTATTQAGLVSFESSAHLDAVLTPMSVAANVNALKAKVNSLGTGGVTATGPGIQLATTQLTGANAIPGHAKMEVVLSDGLSNSGISPVTAATQAYSAGIIVHSVGIVGANDTEMQNIANAGHGIYTKVNNLSDLENIFNGTAGNLVGLDHINLIMPDNTVLNNYATDGLGNFIAPNWALMLGDNLFTVEAFGTDGTSATASCHLFGTAVPVPGSLLLLGSGLIGLAGVRMRFWR